jgi:nucleoside phosphorylase
MMEPQISFEMPKLIPEEADVLVVTAVDVEWKMLVDAWQALFHSDAPPRSLPGTDYAYLGRIGGNHTVLVQQTRMGDIGPGRAYATVERGLLDWRPRAVVMLGIAYGIRGKLGDVLISDTVRYIDARKEGTDPHTGERVTIPRGERSPVAREILAPFKRAAKTWENHERGAGHEPVAVKFGVLLSGDVLIDNRDFRDAQVRFEPEALGGEMEAAGLENAAAKYDVPWIVVKAISDYADGNKGEDKQGRQEHAAANAARFVLHTLASERLGIPRSDTLPCWDEQAYDVDEMRQESPFLGLRSFGYDDRDKYVGREELAREIVRAISNRDGPPQAIKFIVGASGTGKSSFAQAGLLPALEHHYLQDGKAVDKLLVPTQEGGALNRLARAQGVEPAPTPAATAEAVLVRLHERSAAGWITLIVLDQFEELFTVAAPEHRDALLALLESLPPFTELHTHFVIAMRDVFLRDLSDHSALHGMAKSERPLDAMSLQQIQDAIQRPIRVAFPLKHIQPALLDRMAKDAKAEVSHLPLLQVTLDRIWRERGNLSLGGSGYHSLGDAIDQHAEGVFAWRWKNGRKTDEPRDKDVKPLLLELLLAMVTVDQNRSSRRYARVPRRLEALTQGNKLRTELADELTSARLLVSKRDQDGGAETLTIIHETVLSRWERLGREIDEQWGWLRKRARFEEQLGLWRADPAKLLEGNQLKEAIELDKEGDIALRDDEARTFLRDSQEQVRKQQEDNNRRLLSFSFSEPTRVRHRQKPKQM